jgi:hypothetical protein
MGCRNIRTVTAADTGEYLFQRVGIAEAAAAALKRDPRPWVWGKI